MIRATKFAAPLGALFAASAFAHPGHGAVDPVLGPVHYALEPAHWPVALGALAVAVSLGLWHARRRARG